MSYYQNGGVNKLRISFFLVIEVQIVLFSFISVTVSTDRSLWSKHLTQMEAEGHFCGMFNIG